MSEMMILTMFAIVSIMRITGRNFVKAKCAETNCNFEGFENTVNLIYTVRAMEGMMI